jgi:hypothetical protein
MGETDLPSFPKPERGAKVRDNVVSLWNLPKALKASMDLSAPLRQGIMLAPGHPKEFIGAFGPMFHALADAKYAEKINADLMSKDRPGLYLAPIDGKLAAREEAFASNLADKIPGLSASNRAYVTFLNKLRADTYDNTLSGWKAGGKAVSAADQRGLADVLNHFTGRGDLPSKLEDFAPVLNGMFFSPRYQISRVQSLGDAFGVLKSPGSRASRQAAGDMVKFVGAGLSVLTLAKLAGAAVEADPRSSDFGKMRVGNTTAELWGGFQPMARYTAQLITGQSKTVSGKNPGTVIAVKRNDVAMRFAESKLAPSAGAALGVLKGAPSAKAEQGKGYVGTNFVGKGFTLADLVNPVPGQSPESLTSFMSWDDIANAAQNERAGGASTALSTLGLFGAGTNSFDRTPAAAPAPSKTTAPGRTAPTSKPAPTRKAG